MCDNMHLEEGACLRYNKKQPHKVVLPLLLTLVTSKQALASALKEQQHKQYDHFVFLNRVLQCRDRGHEKQHMFLLDCVVGETCRV